MSRGKAESVMSFSINLTRLCSTLSSRQIASIFCASSITSLAAGNLVVGNPEARCGKSDLNGFCMEELGQITVGHKCLQS